MEKTERIHVPLEGCVYAIDPSRVDLDEFVNVLNRKGGLVRVDGNPADAIMVLYPHAPSVEFQTHSPPNPWPLVLGVLAIVLVLLAVVYGR